MAVAVLFVALSFYVYYQPVAIVLPHHNLVETTRQQFLKDVSRRRLFTRHIILLSPDHFSPQQTQVTSSTRDWNLSTGKAKYNNFLEVSLPQNNSIYDDHGIYNPLTDLKKSFPLADFFPVLIGQQTVPSDLQSLLTQIKNKCGFDCLVVASVDFSHYLPATLAEVHDVFTLNNLQNLDLDKILLSEVDSPQSLYLLSSFARFQSAFKWSLYAHTNSGIIAANPDVETTTHVFGSYARGKHQPSTNLAIIHLPYQLNRSQSQQTVGDRFFYGVDKSVVDSYLPNFVIATTITPSHTIKSFLPLNGNNFVRGADKQKLIKRYFDSISNPKVIKDYFWGTLIYE